MGFVVIGLLTIFGLITLQKTVADTGTGNDGGSMISGSGNNQDNMHKMMMDIDHNLIHVTSQGNGIVTPDYSLPEILSVSQ